MSWLSDFWNKLTRRKPKPTPPPPVVPPTPPATPGFTENFANLNNWIVSTWGAPGGGKFSANNATISNGMLCLTLSQPQTNSITGSVGGEVQCNKLMGYGTYEWIARASSTASTPSTVGTVLSGCITGMFNFVNNSQTEIDFEVESNSRSNLMQLTNWSTTKAQQASQIPMNPTPDLSFHVYKFVWSAGKIDFYIDNGLVKTHTQNVPSAPAYMMFNHWGSNDPNWGGPVVAGTSYMWVKSFSFTPL